MKTRRHAVVLLRGITLAVALSLAPLATLWADLPKAAAPPPPSMAVAQSAYGHLPISFEVNQGQTDSRVNYLARGHGYQLLLTPGEALLALRPPAPHSSASPSPALSQSSRAGSAEGTLLHLHLLGATHTSTLRGLDELPGKVNYLTGDNPQEWRTNISTFAKVTQPQVYPGIDMVYYGNQQRVEFDFIVAPGADPRVIRLKVDGADRLEIDVQGDLLLHMSSGDIQLQRPRVYQEIEGVRRELSGHYVVNDAQEVSFQVGTYDASRPLVIDPVLSYSTYLGGSQGDEGYGIAVDTAGSAYVAGNTQSTNFPTVNPLQPGLVGGNSAFVTKLNATGTALVYSTYLGGGTQIYHMGRDIAVDGLGNAYVTGMLGHANTADEDVFVMKLNAAGTALLYNAVVGGGGTENGRDIAVDGLGNAYVTGFTNSPDFPTASSTPNVPPAQAAFAGGNDAFVLKLNTAGGLVYSTFLGGSGAETGYGIAVDTAGNAYLTGYTTTTDFPTASPLQATNGGSYDAFVAKLNADGTALVYSTYLGGSSEEYGNELGGGIAVDTAGNAYVTGSTNSSNFPTVNPLQATNAGRDAFVAKLNTAGSALAYSTYLGGSGGETPFGIAVDTAGNAYVTGDTTSTDFPTASPLQATFGGGNQDAFVAKLNAAGSALVYSSYLGGPGDEGGLDIAVDAAGSAYVTGTTFGSFPTTASAFQTVAAGSLDAFAAKISFVQSPGCSAAVANPASIWTPDGQFVPIVVTGVTDPDGDSVTITVTTVTQDEPVKGKGNKTSPDAVIQDGSSSVRAERLNSGNGRVYQISFSADDGKGGSCTGAVKVGVPLSLRKGLAAIDDGQVYNSTIP